MATKTAVVIGNCEYQDQNLVKLCCPSSDVAEFAKLLEDRDLGSFDSVTSYLNESREVIERAISKLFLNRQRDDLVLLYFSGHGLRDDAGELYLAVKDTEHTDLDGTAVAASYVKRLMNKSSSRRQVMILDCCHSGAFSEGMKAETIGSSVGTKAAFDEVGFGRVILTASDKTQYAWEGESIVGEKQNSLYTSFLIEGIRTGKADLSGDGIITVDELHEYVYRRTVDLSSKQTPTKIGDGEQGSMILSRAPIYAAPLAPSVQQALGSSLAEIRKTIVDELVRIFLQDSASKAISAHQALVGLTKDDSFSVREAAQQAIEKCAGKRPQLPPKLLEEIAKDAGPGLGEAVAANRQHQEEAAAAERFQRRVDEQMQAQIAENHRLQKLQEEQEAAKRHLDHQRRLQEAQAEALKRQQEPQPKPKRTFRLVVQISFGCVLLLIAARVTSNFKRPAETASSAVGTASAPVAQPPENGGAVDTRSSESDQSRAKRSPAGTAMQSDGDADIKNAVARWRAAMLANDAQRVAACYADQVSQYFLQKNVTRDWIYQYLVGTFGNGDSTQAMQISDETITPVSDSVVVVQFVENSDSVQNGLEKHYIVRTTLHYVSEGGEWKINYERQMKIPGVSD